MLYTQQISWKLGPTGITKQCRLADVRVQTGAHMYVIISLKGKEEI